MSEGRRVMHTCERGQVWAIRVDPTTTGWGMSLSSIIISPPYSNPLGRSGCIPQPDSRLILVGCVMTCCCAVKPRGDYKRNYRLEIASGRLQVRN